MNSQSSRISRPSSNRQPASDELAREDRRGEVDEVALVELRERERLPEPLDVPVAEHAFRVRRDHARLRILRGSREQPGEVVGEEDVVVVEEGDPAPRAASSPALAAAARGSRPVRRHQAQRVRPAGGRQRRMCRAAGGDDQHFRRRTVLRGDRRERRVERGPRHAAHDHADVGRGGVARRHGVRCAALASASQRGEARRRAPRRRRRARSPCGTSARARRRRRPTSRSSRSAAASARGRPRGASSPSPRGRRRAGSGPRRSRRPCPAPSAG